MKYYGQTLNITHKFKMLKEDSEASVFPLSSM